MPFVNGVVGMNRRIADIQIGVVIVARVFARVQRIGPPTGADAIFIDFVLMRSGNTAVQLTADAQAHGFYPLPVRRVKIHAGGRIGRNNASVIRTPVIKFTRKEDNGGIAGRFVKKVTSTLSACAKSLGVKKKAAIPRQKYPKNFDFIFHLPAKLKASLAFNFPFDYIFTLKNIVIKGMATPQKNTTFFRRVVMMIKKIPRGKVATYGQMAALAGNPRAARQVAWVLHSASHKEKLPWQRVINSQGGISLPRYGGYELQRALLVKEGVKFDVDDRIALARFQWNPKVFKKDKTKKR